PKKETPKKDVSSESSSDGKSFTQTLREQGLIATGEDTSDEVAKEETPKEAPKKDISSESSSDGKSFTQTLREQGLIVTGEDTSDEVVNEETPKEAPKKEVPKKEAPKKDVSSESSSDGKSFTQTLREQGLIISEDSSRKK
ncbi:MAG: hypothetical protein PUA60_01330, partial [Methanobacteriaceae archaeon]|nr:hypothetical protein [Methanobacteriaceae archaeon]